MRTLLALLLATAGLHAQQKVWHAPTAEEFFAGARSIDPRTNALCDEIKRRFAESNVAKFTYTVPPGSKLTVDGYELRVVDGVAIANTPSLPDDRSYRYTVRCCTPDGQCQTQVVNFRRGAELRVNFSNPTRPGGSPGRSTTAGTIARPVDALNTWSPASMGTAPIRTGAGRAALRGGTDGCASPGG